MDSRPLAGGLAVLCLLGWLGCAAAAEDATTFRVFLKDGTSLVSFGEFARVGDRIVFSMPTAAGPNPPLHLINLAGDRVDWERTDRYAASARAAHYLETQADYDYAALSGEMTQSLNEVALTSDPSRRLAIVERARQTLADWPASHYNYRSAEIRQLLTMLDDAIADLRASSGPGRFDLALSAYAELPAITEPLLPAPTPKDAIEQTLLASRLADSPAERVSLLTAAISSLDASKDTLSVEWARATRDDANARVQAELRLDRQYQALTKTMMELAHRRASVADVRGVQRVVARIRLRDQGLGGLRPDAVNALVAAVEDELDAARKLRLARDRWALRAPELKSYREAVQWPIDLFTRLKQPLEDIKALAGSPPMALAMIHQVVGQIVRSTSAIVPPDDLRAAHALLVSAAQLADNAARLRREATLDGNMSRAWDASSAAAGALMLASQARSEIRTLLAPPRLR